ncbi:MAG: hypothetical protein GEV04_11865 [Actinophytocola sp.]|nr:hypothetical protein [Actinophytocola sp.]
MTDPYGGSPQASDTSAPTGGSVLGGRSSSTEAIVDSARSVRDDFTYGDDRAILNPPNWASQSSTQLYNGAVNDNDPGFADSMGQTWNHHGTELGHVADALYEAINELGGVWVGQAAGAAQGALVGVANASSTAGDAARTMGKRMSQQAAAAAEVKKMPPPKDFDYNAELDKLLAGHPAAMSVSDIKSELDASQAVRAEQQRYMDEYTRAMSEVDSTTPSFGPDSIGMKPVASGTYASSSTAAAGGGVNVTGGGASLAGARGAIDAAQAPGAKTGAPVAGGAGGALFAGGNAGHGMTAAPGSVAATGSSAVSAQASGPGSAGLLGGAALGAGVGLAGARALAKGGRSGGKHSAARQQEREAAEAQAAEEAAAAETTVADAQYGEPPTQQAAGVSWQPPQGQQPLAAGATTGAADSAAAAPEAGQVTASTDNSASAQQAAGQQQPQQLTPQQQAQAASQAGPVAPMQGHGPAPGSGAGAAGVDAGDVEHEQASYLIEPDPDDVFGPTDTATAGVIGAELEDD